MTDLTRTRARRTITVLVALAELGHLAWEHFHGGVVSHHLLNRADLPAISNAWGAVFLPALAWFLFLIALAITITLFATSRRWVYYAGGD